jgi:6,7-dimethyl-8-ribityllumazine synthase
MAQLLIVEARFYAHLNDLLLAGARAAIEQAGHRHETITVPGALEIPGAIALAIDSGRWDGFVALGVVIRGETYHFEIVAGESARGIMALTMTRRRRSPVPGPTIRIKAETPRGRRWR